MIGRLSLLLTLAMAFVCGSPPSALAENVLLLGGNGKGQGWLFGTAGRDGDVECWLAFPRHVAAAADKPVPASIEFIDREGRRGEAGPIRDVASIKGALAATKGQADLAFARVRSGRPNGHCLSRLGLTARSNDALIRLNRDLQVVDTDERSDGQFAVRILRNGTMESASRILIQPENSADQGYLRGGLSGATVMVRRDDVLHPLAIVQELSRDKQAAFALRFDAIDIAFGLLRDDEGSHAGQGGADAAPAIRIAAYMAETISGNGPSTLEQPGGCWRARAISGSRAITVTVGPVQLRKDGGYLEVERGSACGDGQVLPIGLDVSRDDGQTFSRVADCLLEEGAVKATCRIPRSGAVLVRVVFRAPALALSAIRLR